jgi:WD40 repeat protein
MGDSSSAAGETTKTSSGSGFTRHVQRRWRPNETNNALELPEHSAAITAIAISKGGERIATGTADGWVRVFGAAGTLISERKEHNAEVLSLALSPDGLRVASSALEQPVRVLQTDSKSPSVELRVSERINAVAFSADGQHVATGGHEVLVWSLDSPHVPVTLGRVAWSVDTLRYSPGGDWVVAASSDTVFMARSDGYERPLVFPMPESTFSVGTKFRNVVRGVAFTADGGRVITAANDGYLRFFPLSISELKKSLGALNHDCLPSNLRIQYLGETAKEAMDRFVACELWEGRAP